MLAALQSLVLGTALASGPTAAEQPLDVTLIATDAHADRVAQLLAPRLADAGFHAEFRRCDDFGCVLEPSPGDGPALIVVVSAQADDTLVIVSRVSPNGGGVQIVMNEVPVAVPSTTLDGETLGFAVVRDLTEPPPDHRTEWSVARREGLDRAPPPEPATPATPAPTPAPTPAFGRGAYLELAGGSTSGFSGSMAFGIASMVGGGFLFDSRQAPHFRVALGVHAVTHNELGRERPGLFFGAARLGLGAATPRLLAMAHLGAGPGMVYGGRYGGGVRSEVQGFVSLSGSLRIRVSEKVGLGVEVGTLLQLPFLEPQLSGLFNATFIWDAPRRKESGR